MNCCIYVQYLSFCRSQMSAMASSSSMGPLGENGLGGRRPSLVLPPDDDAGPGDECFLPPADDGGDDLFLAPGPQIPTPKGKPQSKKTNKKVDKKIRNKEKQAARRAVKKQRNANSDASMPKASVQKRTKEPCSNPQPVAEGQVFPWTHDRLKDAAASFVSRCYMPLEQEFQDLRELHAEAISLGKRGIGPSVSDRRCTLWEVYSLPRMGPKMREIGGRSRRSYDIKHFVDLSEKDYVHLLLQDVALYRPYYLSLSPPCTMVCQLQASNWNRRKNIEKKYLDLEQALHHIDLTVWLSQFQHHSMAYYGFEHPAGSLAWDRASAP